jgi:hypothetical protein
MGRQLNTHTYGYYVCLSSFWFFRRVHLHMYTHSCFVQGGRNWYGWAGRCGIAIVITITTQSGLTGLSALPVFFTEGQLLALPSEQWHKSLLERQDRGRKEIVAGVGAAHLPVNLLSNERIGSLPEGGRD